MFVNLHSLSSQRSFFVSSTRVVTSNQHPKGRAQLALNGTEAVRTESLVRHYILGHSTIRAVDGVTLAVKKGEVAALLGTSGSGKATLMNLIAGLDDPTSGSIFVEGQERALLNHD